MGWLGADSRDRKAGGRGDRDQQTAPRTCSLNRELNEDALGDKTFQKVIMVK